VRVGIVGQLAPLHGELQVGVALGFAEHDRRHALAMVGVVAVLGLRHLLALSWQGKMS
jgi:hypothetical protein